MTSQSPPAGDHVLVLGAGIIGTCCALWLQRLGFRVTLVDRDEPGSGCSAGNAGIIHSGAMLPLATPGILARVPRMLLDPEGPLVIRWGYLPRLLPWFARLVRNATPARVDATARALIPLLDGAMEAYRPLLADAGLTDMLKDRGELYVFQGELPRGTASDKLAGYRKYGVPVIELDAKALRDYEPALSPAYNHGYYLPRSAFTVDPRALTNGLAQNFVRNGGTLLRLEAREIERAGEREVLVRTSGETLTGDRVVIALGAFSRPLARRAGIEAPLETLRGYHLELPAPKIRLNGPLIEGAMNFGVTPMAGGIRLAGTIEFAGLDAPPNWRRAEMLLPMAKGMLPGLDGDHAVRWMGHRPGLPDGRPMIGPAPEWPEVWFAFGHAQIGLTTGAITGRSLAEAMAGRTGGVDLSPFAANRFAAGRRQGKM